VAVSRTFFISLPRHPTFWTGDKRRQRRCAFVPRGCQKEAAEDRGNGMGVDQRSFRPAHVFGSRRVFEDARNCSFFVCFFPSSPAFFFLPFALFLQRPKGGRVGCCCI
jgi:hypothetical protein